MQRTKPQLSRNRRRRPAAGFVLALLALLCGASCLSGPGWTLRRSARGARSFLDIEYANADGKPLRLDLYLPGDAAANARPLVVWIHGGGLIAGSKKRGPAGELTAHGYAVASVEYRLSPEVRYPAQLYDCKAAVRWLRAHAREYNLDTERIGVWGASDGGYLACMMGLTSGKPEFEGNGGNAGQSSRISAVCDWFGTTDFLRELDQAGEHSRRARAGLEDRLVKVFGGPVAENRERIAAASALLQVSAASPPFLIMHGDRDRVVPIGQSEDLHEALRKAGVEVTFQRVPGAGHGIGFNKAELYRTVAAFFDKHLRRLG